MPSQNFRGIDGSIATNPETVSNDNVSNQTEGNQNFNLSHGIDSDISANATTKNVTNTNPEGDLMVGSLNLVSCILCCRIITLQHGLC